MKTIFKYVPHLLLALYLIEFTVCAIHPYSRDVWWAENTPIFLIALGLTVLYMRGVRFSNLAYILMSVLLFWHTIGGYYTFERVPFHWFDSLFGFERNMFDRVGHFSVGFYAFALCEFLIVRGKVNGKFWAYAGALCFIGTVAMTYELIEWQYAVREGGSAGAAFLGSQGDEWDAQADMFMDTLGAITALALYGVRDMYRVFTQVISK